MKAIETRYKGYRFRSRTEARWAVYLDALGRKWEYERQGYDLPSGPYLPDFWLPIAHDLYPAAGYWLEIKGEPPTERERLLCEELAAATKHHVILIAGPPAPGQFRVYKTVIGPTRGREDDDPATFDAYRLLLSHTTTVPDWHRYEDVGFALSYTYSGSEAWNGGRMPQVGDALAAASSARFEHGETPLV